MLREILLKKFENKREVEITISYLLIKRLNIKQIDYIIFCTKFFEKFNGLEISYISEFVKKLNDEEINIQQCCILKKENLQKENLYTKLL